MLKRRRQTKKLMRIARVLCELDAAAPRAKRDRRVSRVSLARSQY